MKGTIQIKKLSGRKQKIKVRYLVFMLGFMGLANFSHKTVQAMTCPDLNVIFARGSGSEQNTDMNYLEFKKTIETKLKMTSLSYDFIDLDYPAIGIDSLEVSIGAWLGAGDAYEFGESVKSGVKKLDNLVTSSCPGTKYVLGGYSQGAMVVSQSLKNLSADKIIYAATFGDPKIYLPEGEGLLPAACRGENLSDYRMYVPDCQAYKGLLGAYVPYEPVAFKGKVGTWCNKRDIFCSSHFDMNDHTSYVSENLYEDASRVIFDKICKSFNIKNTVSSPHDTAILIDSTGSMKSMIDKYKTEAMRLARQTLEAGGRVALYDYRDLDDPYQPVQHCSFENCTLELLESELSSIKTANGGDGPESLLSGSLHVMKELNWKKGATKSLVVLTDTNFLSPDRDGVTFDEVVRLSKEIDPVNFYIITNAINREDYTELATATGGKVVTNLNRLDLLTDYIMERYDSLPRVEESTMPTSVPELEIINVINNNNSATIKFKTNAKRVAVSLNDGLLGIVEVNLSDETGNITISELNREIKNRVLITPLGDSIRGEGVEVLLNNYVTKNIVTKEILKAPKAPNTGRK